ncbi:MAG TPA: tetratricopeptide repeat protein [Candidatus Polarisedimenticolaceae bacterium]|nr:tetratricopeptide repeat protein [Candidatus Polarisedimenticolaceae bacterium]
MLAPLLLAAMTHTAPAADASKPPLFDDLGSYHRAITTASAEAQKYFDQGLRLVYGFNHDEAERAFREAVRLDPACAICWWGVGLTLGPNINLPIDADRNAKAVEAVGRAKALREKAGPVERALIDALTTRYSADPAADRAALDQAYADAMQRVRKRFPKDDDVATLAAEAMMDLRPWKFWTPDGKPAPGTLEILSILESVLKRNPSHPGANHYYIHATEASPNAGRALPSAKRLETLMPGAGHLVHMPAHTYMRTGNYAGASEANAKAAAVDEKYIRAHDVKGVYPAMYYTHNLQFLAAAAAMEGRSAVSLDAAKRTTEAALPLVKEMPMAEFVVPFDLYYKLRFGKWDEVLAWPEPDPSLATTAALRRFGRAAALAAQGKVPEALEEQKAYLEAAARVPPDAVMNLNTSKDLLAVATASLDARIAVAKGDRDAAIEAWRRTVAAEDLLAYDEPPAWYYPTRESLGGELLRAGRAAEAERVFRDDLDRNPGNGRSLFGLAEALKAQKKTGEAAKVETRFKTAWARADIPVTVAGL